MTTVNINESTFDVKFKLTVEVTGSNLQDIDDGLIKAATTRLTSRLATPLKMPEVVAPNNTVERHTVAAATPSAPEPKRRGRKPGTKMGPYNRNKGSNENEETNESDQETKEVQAQTQSDEEIEEAPQTEEALRQRDTGNEARSGASNKRTPAPATAQQAVDALKLVNSTFNVDKARECLAHFNVKRCSDLTDDDRGLFVAHCESVCRK